MDGGVTISSSGGNLNLPIGTTVAGMNYGLLKLLGAKTKTADLPPTAALGDSYLVDRNVYIYVGTDGSVVTSPAGWQDGGVIQGPRGLDGIQGQSVKGDTGERGIMGLTGATGIKGEKGNIGEKGEKGDAEKKETKVLLGKREI